MHKIILITFLTLLYFNVFSQDDRGCGSVKHNKNIRQDKHEDFENAINERIALNKNARTSINEELYIIPVVVHVIHNNSNGAISGNNISEAQILSQIDVLNEDFSKKNGTKGYNTDPNGADTKIQFCLAKTDPYCRPTNGITRHYYPKNDYDMDSDNRLIKSLGYWPSDKYLNIWVCVLNNDILGYATFPQKTGFNDLDDLNVTTNTDGVVINTTVFGRININKPSFAYGRTATHEVGHWLCLRHVWGDEYCGDDYCSDTRTQDNPTRVDRDCPSLYSFCNGNVELKNSNNYLDYSADGCMNTFTNDQKNRMRAVIEISAARKSVVKNAVIACQKPYSANIPYLQDFSSNNGYINEGWITKISDTTSVAVNIINENLEIVKNTNLPQNTNTISLESPYFNFTNSVNPTLSFNIKSILNQTLFDTLSIYVATSCDGNWTLIKNVYFKNASDSLISVSLSKYSNNEQVKIKFEYNTKSNFHGVSLDDLFISEFKEWPFVATDNKMHFYNQNLQNNEKMNVTIYQYNGKKMQEFSFEKSSDLISTYELPLLEPSLYLAIYEKNGETKKDKFIILSEK